MGDRTRRTAKSLFLLLFFALLRLSDSQEGADCGEHCCTEGEEGTVRLKGGRRDSEGYVELCLDGAWGTLCDEYWDNRDAGVICYMLGYHRENALASKFSRFVVNRQELQSSGQRVLLDSIRCEGHEESILDCSSTTDEDCYEHLENAGVVCEEDTCVDGEVRLVGGSDAKEGRVEVCIDNVWGTVCNDAWTDENTLVTCTQLRLENPDDSRDTHLMLDFGPGDTPPSLLSVQCTGSESDLSECPWQQLVGSNHTCYPAGVMCNAPCHFQYSTIGCSAVDVHPEYYNYYEFCYCSQLCHVYAEENAGDESYLSRGDCCRDILLIDNCIVEERECVENDIRIVDGTRPWNGRLEICLGGVWGAVCEYHFEDVDAAVACRQLNMSTENALAVPGGTFGASDQMWIRDVECSGSEELLVHCTSSSPGYFRGCSEDNCTGIWCAGEAPEPECTEGDIQLAGGLNELGGRVEFCHGGVWGSVCDHGFGETEARVVCHQLGFDESWSVVTAPLFGTGMGPIHLDDVACQGNESSLLECSHRGLRVHNCYRYEEAAVTCRADPVESCVNLEEPPSLTNDMILEYGDIVTFQGLSEIEFCNETFLRGDDYLFLPHRLSELWRRKRPSAEDTVTETELSQMVVEQIGQSYMAASPECQQLFNTYICNSIFLRTENNSGNISLPSPVCSEQCVVLRDKCNILWKAFTRTDIGEGASCNNTGRLLEPLPYCCHGTKIPSSPSDNPRSAQDISGLAAGVSFAVIFLLAVFSLLAAVIILVVRKYRNLKTILYGREEAVNALEMLSSLHGRESSRSLILNGKANGVSADAPEALSRKMSDGFFRYSRNSLTPFSATPYVPSLSPISSRYLRQLTTDMLIPQSQLRLLDSIGSGEFGIVYKAHYLQGIKNGRTTEPQIVAVKTLKGYFDKEAIHILLEESVKMKEFDHPNVLTLFGVCVDAGPAPYIVMPYMAKGSLLSYLRKERNKILLTQLDESEDVEDVRRRLVDIIHQIAKGMAYLADKKFVHRDLATRNCMMDGHNVIRVSDFGLSEDMYAKNYFRQDKDAVVKLPIKWMAPESLNDGIFTEKSDVWSYGVTCWEVFSAGKAPYPGINPVSLVRVLEDGERLEKPVNAACPDFVYKLMLDCWNINPDKRPKFKMIASEMDRFMEESAGYLALSSMAAVEREGEAMMEERSDTESPESVSMLIRGVRTGAGITIRLDICDDPVHNDYTTDTNETSV